MAEAIVAVLLLGALLFGGLVLTFNLFDLPLGLAFSNITSIQSGFWIIALRLIIAPALVLFSAYVIYNLIKEGF